MEKGIHAYLGTDQRMLVYLDNGSFAYWRKGIEPPIDDYVEFVTECRPDWYPIPADYIPHPQLTSVEQKLLFNKTMQINLEYTGQGFVPIHVLSIGAIPDANRVSTGSIIDCTLNGSGAGIESTPVTPPASFIHTNVTAGTISDIHAVSQAE